MKTLKFAERHSPWPANARGATRKTHTFSVLTGVLTGTDRRELEERAVRLARFRNEDTADRADCLNRLPETWAVGTPSEIVERIRTYESLGVDRIMFLAPLHDDLEMLEMIGREVLPFARR